MNDARQKFERLLDAATEHHERDLKSKIADPKQVLVQARIAATASLLSTDEGARAYLEWRAAIPLAGAV
jgi:hypothetical protein